MAEYFATIAWNRGNAKFSDNRYSRAHEWRFDGGAAVPASSSPHVVPLPFSDPRGVDPEEAFVASLSSCHMLWFLSIAAKAGFVADSYVDEAVGVMAKNAEGKLAMTKVALRPKVTYVGAAPTADVEARLHHDAHEACFIASSVKTDLRVEPR